MIKALNINKEYIKGEKILKDINIIFRNNEFVSILGTSGSGKSTFLNILGAIDKKYEGEIYFNSEKLTKQKKGFYDSFHNKKIGIVFQDYNLIENYTVYKNIEIVLSISKEKNKKEKIEKILKEVNMQGHINKKAKELSGGEKQRIAIARALINDPEILLLDEPTGALDTKTSTDIMNLVTKMTKNKLVIMVTHDKNLAEKYSSRIIKIQDGTLISDTNPCIKEETKENKKMKKTSISWIESYKLALKNLKTKPVRNILTFLGMTISLIGLSIVLSIGTGFKKQIDNLKNNELSNYPIILKSKEKNKEKNKKKIYAYQIKEKEYISNEIIKKIKKEHTYGIINIYDYNFNVVAKIEKIYKFSNTLPFIEIPVEKEYLMKNYKIFKGNYIKDKYEIMIKLDSNNCLEKEVLEFLGINKNIINPNELIGKEFKIIQNDNLYKKEKNIYKINEITEKLYENKNNITLKVVGIVKAKTNLEFNTIVNEEGGAIYFSDDLIKEVKNKNKNSKIIKDQLKENYNVIDKTKIINKEEELERLGRLEKVSMMYIYPKDYKSKKIILKEVKKLDENIEIIDLSNEVVKSFKTIIFGITSILTIFSIISLIVTLILISVMTYTSVLERRKEIGILKIIGARNKDIKRIITRESIIISLSACIVTIFLIRGIIPSMNNYLYKIIGLKKLMILDIHKISILFITSIIVSLLGSLIPTYKISNDNNIKNIK